jgi:hypothetical protein
MEGVRHGVGALFKLLQETGLKKPEKTQKPAAITKNSIPDVKSNEKQLKFQERYNRGEITFDAYRAGRDKQSD